MRPRATVTVALNLRPVPRSTVDLAVDVEVLGAARLASPLLSWTVRRSARRAVRRLVHDTVCPIHAGTARVPCVRAMTGWELGVRILGVVRASASPGECPIGSRQSSRRSEPVASIRVSQRTLMRSGSRSWPRHVHRSSSGSGAGVVHHYTALEAASLSCHVGRQLRRRTQPADVEPPAGQRPIPPWGGGRHCAALRRFDFRRVATGGRGLGRC